MNPTENKVEQAIAGLDDTLQPLNKDDPKAADDKIEPKVEEKTSDKPADPTVKDTPPPKADDDEAEGYLADEAGGELGQPSPSPTDATPPPPAGNLTPEQQFIYDNLPTLSVRGKDGHMYNVKVDTELPESFDFASKADERSFYRDLTAQELNARELRNQFMQSANAQQAANFEERENESIRQDVADLQREGVMPRFKLKVEDPKFDGDPAAKQMQEILDVMTDRNEQYLKEFQQGRSYRHIGFKEAYDVWAKTSKEGKAHTEQQKEDRERKGIADKVTSRPGLAQAELAKPVVRSGTSTRDLMARIDAMDI